MGDIYLTTNSNNPSTKYLGTTWQKIEGRFLLGASSNYNLGATGGSSTVTLTINNLPSHNHSASTASHTHSQPAHTHSTTFKAFFGTNEAEGGFASGSDGVWRNLTFNTSSAGGETTGSASPVTSIGNTGNGQSFSIMPNYLVVNIWKRTS